MTSWHALKIHEEAFVHVIMGKTGGLFISLKLVKLFKLVCLILTLQWIWTQPFICYLKVPKMVLKNRILVLTSVLWIWYFRCKKDETSLHFWRNDLWSLARNESTKANYVRRNSCNSPIWYHVYQTIFLEKRCARK